MATGRRPYHHGDLRRVVLDAALEVVAEHGPAALSLRDLARRAGVSHAAPAHHFGDKAGLLTALATEGYRRLAEELLTTLDGTGSFLEVGVAYVRFAVTNRGYFEVMFRPDLLHVDDPDLQAARAAAGAALYGPAGEASGGDAVHAGVAAWSFVHGLATLWLTGNLPPALGDDPEAITRASAAVLFGGASRP